MSKLRSKLSRRNRIRFVSSRVTTATGRINRYSAQTLPWMQLNKNYNNNDNDNNYYNNANTVRPILFVLYTVDLLMVSESHGLSPDMQATPTTHIVYA